MRGKRKTGAACGGVRTKGTILDEIECGSKLGLEKPQTRKSQTT
jgi:hypothetical protein